MPKGAISLTGTFLLVMAMIYFAYIFTKILAEKSMGNSYSKYIELVDRYVLGKDRSICIFHIGARYFLVGSSESEITILSELKEEDLIELSKDPIRSSAFLESFKQELGKRIPKKQ